MIFILFKVILKFRYITGLEKVNDIYLYILLINQKYSKSLTRKCVWIIKNSWQLSLYVFFFRQRIKILYDILKIWYSFYDRRKEIYQELRFTKEFCVYNLKYSHTLQYIFQNLIRCCIYRKKEEFIYLIIANYISKDLLLILTNFKFSHFSQISRRCQIFITNVL